MGVTAENVQGGKFVSKQSLLNDVSKAYRDGLYNDITFTLADNVTVSTNKFMLASRVPFFATMLFSEMAAVEAASDNRVSLMCCDSEIFKRILNFTFEGELLFSDMSIQSLLDLLETSRFLCIEPLVEGIEEHMKQLLNLQKVKYQDCLVALNFTISERFCRISKMFLSFIDQNLAKISCLPEFSSLSGASMLALLTCEGRVSTEMERFSAFSAWMKNKEESVPTNVKNEMLSSFNLDRFDKIDLVKTVRKTQFFDKKDICDALEKHIEKMVEMEVTMETQTEDIEDKNEKIESLEEDIELIKEEMKTIETGDFSLIAKWNGSQHECKLNQRRFINKIQFNLDQQYQSSYILRSRCSFEPNWTNLKVTADVVHSGKQTVHFCRKRMDYIAIKATKSNFKSGRLCTSTASVSGIVASMI